MTNGENLGILMVGSMSADLREPSNDIYAATKAAIQAFAEALRKNANEKGDLYVRLKVQIPKYLSAKQRELLEEASRLKF